MYFVKHSNSDEYVYRRAKMPMASNVIPRDNTPTITIIDVSTNARLCFNRIWSFSSFSYLVSAYYRVQPPSSKSDATLSPSIARKMPCVRTASRLSVVKITFEHISPAKLFLSFHWFHGFLTPILPDNNSFPGAPKPHRARRFFCCSMSFASHFQTLRLGHPAVW